MEKQGSLCSSCEHSKICLVNALDLTKVICDRCLAVHDFNPYGVVVSITGCYDYVDGTQLTSKKVMVKYPLLVSHIICQSLGYASPTMAAIILKDTIQGKPNYCEWVDACYKGNAKQVVIDSIKMRSTHKGYMASFQQAKALVFKSINDGQEPVFASWF